MAKDAQLVTLIPIRNMNRAIKFYTGTLDGKLVMRGTGQMKNYWAALNIAGADVWFVAPEKREPRKLAYTTFIVKDIRKYVAKLQRRKVKFDRAERMGPDTKIEGPIAFDENGAAAYFKDPEGNLLMIFQVDPRM